MAVDRKFVVVTHQSEIGVQVGFEHLASLFERVQGTDWGHGGRLDGRLVRSWIADARDETSVAAMESVTGEEGRLTKI